MSLKLRVAIALLVIVVDMTVVFIPVTALLLAYVLVALPDWFITQVKNVYGDVVCKTEVSNIEQRMKQRREEIEKRAIERITKLNNNKKP